ncbi:MAG: putative von Willebrand factor type, partial [Armatimonadetes bacterium]|nr:putative von Willebrand factor type [Armatimonadota bacterium]
PKEAPGVEVALASKQDDPVLASWRYGLGKAVAFTSDAKNRWAAPWVGNPGMFAKFWAQTIRWTVRSTARANLDTQVEINQRKGKVVIDVVDAKGNFVNMLDIRGSVAGENVSPKLRIDQTAPGRYEGEFEAPDKGQYLIALTYTDEHGTPRTHRVGAAVPYSPEYHDLSANTAVLTALADKTGGRVYPALSAKSVDEDLRRVWRHDRRTHSAPDDLWPALVLLAALLLPVDIGVRRLMVTRTELGALLATINEATLGRISGRSRRSAGREAGMGRLLKAKMEAGQRTGADAAAAPVEPEAAAPAVATEPARPRYEGPARTMPGVAGATGVTPPPATGSPVAGARPELGMAEVAPPAAPPKPAAAPPPAEAKPQPAWRRSDTEAPKTTSQPGQVVWNKAPPGVAPPTGAAPPPAPKPSEAAKPADTPPDGDDASTNRLLRAKRRARDKQE